MPLSTVNPPIISRKPGSTPVVGSRLTVALSTAGPLAETDGWLDDRTIELSMTEELSVDDDSLDEDSLVGLVDDSLDDELVELDSDDELLLDELELESEDELELLLDVEELDELELESDELESDDEVELLLDVEELDELELESDEELELLELELLLDEPVGPQVCDRISSSAGSSVTVESPTASTSVPGPAV